MIEFKCQHCGAALAVPGCLAGKTDECPSCHEVTSVPSEQVPGEAELGKLRAQLRHPDPKARCDAAEALGLCKSLEAIELLVGAFRDPDKFVREQVTDSLRHIGDPRGVGMLVRDLGGHWVSAAIVHEAVREVVKFGRAAGQPLIDILTETNQNPRQYEPEAVRAAVMVLGRLREERALPLIAKMFRRHFDIHVRDEAAYALGMIGRPDEWRAIAGLPEGQRRSPARELAKDVIKENKILV